MSTPYIMEVEDLSFQYPDGTIALSHLSLQLKKGTTVGLLGGNGAGKSTLFLNLNGILKPSNGRILYKGTPISYSAKGLSKLRQSIGIVFQDPDIQLFSSSVYEDVSFGLVNLGIPEAQAKIRIDKALHATGVYDLRHKPTHSLSYGQKKRAALAGVIAMEPEVLILDEPTAGLDPQGVSEILALIDSLKKDLNMTIIIATHDMDIVPLMCDYIYVLKDGMIHNAGPVQEVFSNPDILYQAGLCLPYVTQLMLKLKEQGCLSTQQLPTSVLDAYEILHPLLSPLMYK